MAVARPLLDVMQVARARFIGMALLSGIVLIHNRFVLTDRGGVKFGIGLDDDDGDDGQTDDVDLLSQETFDLRWRQYALMQAFDEAVPIATITGTKVLAARV